MLSLRHSQVCSFRASGKAGRLLTLTSIKDTLQLLNHRDPPLNLRVLKESNRTNTAMKLNQRQELPKAHPYEQSRQTITWKTVSTIDEQASVGDYFVFLKCPQHG